VDDLLAQVDELEAVVDALLVEANEAEQTTLPASSTEEKTLSHSSTTSEAAQETTTEEEIVTERHTTKSVVAFEATLSMETVPARPMVPDRQPVVTEEPTTSLSSTELATNPAFSIISGGDQSDSTTVDGAQWDYTHMWDGGESTDAYDDQCFVSESSAKGWSEIYLNGMYIFKTISILNRGDYGSTWANSLKAEVCQGPGALECMLCGKFTGAEAGGVWLSVECPPMLIGNTIRFFNKVNYVAICEVDFDVEQL
jgi:hypothetical protein